VFSQYPFWRALIGSRPRAESVFVLGDFSAACSRTYLADRATKDGELRMSLLSRLFARKSKARFCAWFESNASRLSLNETGEHFKDCPVCAPQATKSLGFAYCDWFIEHCEELSQDEVVHHSDNCALCRVIGERLGYR